MYRVQLQQFEGPLDLLLFFIQRDELDIYDIPIARITDEYLSYLRLIEQIDLDGAGEFIYMAAILIGIKAKMLLPRDEFGDSGEPIDPRQELVERLLEYIRYKEASQHLADRYEERSEHFTRGLSSGEFERMQNGQEVTYRVSVFGLITALKRAMEQAPSEPVHQIKLFDYTIEGQQEYVLDQLQDRPRHSFVDLVARRNKQFVIVTFLAILELARHGALRLSLSAGGKDFYIARGEAKTGEGGSDG